MPDKYTITLTPSPATQGGTLIISYNGPPGTVITLDWDPAAEPRSVTVGASGSVKVMVPANAQSLIASDLSGSTAAATVVP